MSQLQPEFQWTDHPWPTDGCKIAIDGIFVYCWSKAIRQRATPQFQTFYDTLHFPIFPFCPLVCVCVCACVFVVAIYRICGLCIFIPSISVFDKHYMNCHFAFSRVFSRCFCPLQGNGTAGDFYGQCMGWVIRNVYYYCRVIALAVRLLHLVRAHTT